MTDDDLKDLNMALDYCAKPKTKAYRPYCLQCSTMKRMLLKSYGFQCCECFNKLQFNLKPLQLCGNPKCSMSSGICESPTFGSGKLDFYRYWEIPCSICARSYEKHHPNERAWPFK